MIPPLLIVCATIGRTQVDLLVCPQVLPYPKCDAHVSARHHRSPRHRGASDFQIEKVANIIERDIAPINTKDISDETDISKRKVISMVNRLEDVGALELGP